MTLTKTQVRDAALRALHTLWQAFVAALVITWAGSGLDVSQVVDLDSAKRFAIAAGAAIVAALLSAAKSTIAAILAHPADYIEPPTPAAPTPAAPAVTTVRVIPTQRDGGESQAALLLLVLAVICLAILVLKAIGV